MAPLPAHHVAIATSGFAVTTLARTAIDVARDLELPESLQVLDAALRRLCLEVMPGARRQHLANLRLVTAGAAGLREAVSILPKTGRVSQALDYASPLRESPIESLSYGHMVLSRLPLPICQPLFRTAHGTFFPDFYWEEQRLIGESDGRRKYNDPSAIVREKEREQILRDLGFGVVRWLGREIHQDPGRVMARIERALARS